MSKKVILTGGAGFIGHEILSLLLRLTNWEIVMLDRLSYSGNLNRVKDILSNNESNTDNRFRYIYHDLKAPFSNDLINLLKDTNIILHIGASSHVTKSIENPRLFLKDNVEGTFNLLELATTLDNLEIFHYFSTDEVFGPSIVKNKFSEWDRYNSKNPYSASKAAGEEFVIAYENTFAVPSLITHCSNVYGKRQHWEKFIPNTIRKILKNEKIIIHTDNSGIPGSRYYIHNEDVANSVIFLLNNYENIKNKIENIQLTKPAKVNITGKNLITNLEIVEKIGRILDRDFDFILTDSDLTRPKHDVKYGLDNSLIKSIGGYFDRDFDTGLEETVFWYLNNQQWLSLNN